MLSVMQRKCPNTLSLLFIYLCRAKYITIAMHLFQLSFYSKYSSNILIFSLLLITQQGLGQHTLRRYARADTLRSLAYGYWRAQNYESAIKLFNYCKKLEPVLNSNLSTCWAGLGNTRHANRSLKRAIRAGWTFQPYTSAATMAATDMDSVTWAAAKRLDDRLSRRRLADPDFVRWIQYSTQYQAQLPPFRDTAYQRVKQQTLAALAPSLLRDYRKSVRWRIAEFNQTYLFEEAYYISDSATQKAVYQTAMRRAHHGHDSWRMPLRLAAGQMVKSAANGVFVPISGLRWHRPPHLPWLPRMHRVLNVKKSLYPFLVLSDIAEYNDNIAIVEIRVACRSGVKPPGNYEAILRTIKIQSQRYITDPESRKKVAINPIPVLDDSLQQPYSFGIVIYPKPKEEIINIEEELEDIEKY